MENILATIAAATKERIAAQKLETSPEEMARRAEEAAVEELEENAERGIVDPEGAPTFRYPFYEHLSCPGLSFICEVKKASPSAGVIAEDFPFLDIAVDYSASGAAAVSCLTEPTWFQGSDEQLFEIADTVAVPVLRKDFVVDPYMVDQARALGAYAVLLITSLLDDDTLASCIERARILGMDALVEARNEEEIGRALAAGASIIGVNNRNLDDFSVDFGRAAHLRPLVPEDVLFVVESGLKGPEDVAKLVSIGADAVLVGEALMRADDRRAALGELLDAAEAALGDEEAGGLGTEAPADEAAPGAPAQAPTPAGEVIPESEPASVTAPSPSPSPAAAAAPEPEPTPEPAPAAEPEPVGPPAGDPWWPEGVARVPHPAPAVKFCGITCDEDAESVNEVCVDYAGFVFAPASKRCVTRDEANALRLRLDDYVSTVGVFVDADPAEIAFIAACGIISIAQLHGSEDAAYIKRLRALAPSELVIWQAVQVTGPEDVRRGEQSLADFVLFDAGAGSGETFDWSLLADVERPFGLAGGLSPDNIADAMAAVHPVLVDASTGVEAAELGPHGRPVKDRDAMLRFKDLARRPY
ncbi:indole-3-glycerol phosphate synthase TrpC [Eggerthellaceae bacterium zg-887]|uniref:indole-3-glycerol phosphate synthase TrpC n=1 Tax=Xiamenia xianingshaonis TaxID=2682776 RepID=UPI00140C878C|nr:indole-3-glycerol phosphate synthase TrpC [Xiamenia xianingshaonis]NHM15165.1 indole-3-glycerol phosphate synthase TrpC [Xiamenia xianingshaonis]